MLSLTSPRHISTLPIRDVTQTSQMRKKRPLQEGSANGTHRPEAGVPVGSQEGQQCASTGPSRRLGECAKSDPLLPFLVDPGTEGVRQDRLFRGQAPNAPVRPDCLQVIHVSPMVRFSGSEVPIQVRKGLGGWLGSPSHRLIQDNKRAVRYLSDALPHRP
jgi:hypothetical protein